MDDTEQPRPDTRTIAGVSSSRTKFRRRLLAGTRISVSAVAIRPVSPTFLGGQVNSGLFRGPRVNPSVAVDGSGDFTIAWNGIGGNGPEQSRQPTRLPTPIPTASSIKSTTGTAGCPTANGTESVVNVTVTGVQQFPAAGMTADGGVIIGWQGNGPGDRQGIFYRRYAAVTIGRPTGSRGGHADRSSHPAKVAWSRRPFLSRGHFRRAHGSRAATAAQADWANSVYNPANYEPDRERRGGDRRRSRRSRMA